MSINLFLGIFESVIFLGLSGIHFNWAFGGKWAFDKALPTNKNGERVLNPKKKDSFIVGFGLLFLAVMYLMKTGLISLPFENVLSPFAGWLVIIIFLFRAIGDFKYVGFFKKIKKTKFAKRDFKFYSPLCLVIVVIAILFEITRNI